MPKCKYCGMPYNTEEEVQNHMKSSHKSMLALDEQDAKKPSQKDPNYPY